MTIPTTLTTPAGFTPTRDELEADPLAVAVSTAWAAMTATNETNAAPIDLDDRQHCADLAALVRHLRAHGVDVTS